MKPLANQPIGLFDSGVGGLTVARAISQLLPHETLIYFGDTAHMPYGERSNEHIMLYATRIAEFLVEQGAKMLVIACNSASAVAFDVLKEKYRGQLDVVGVIAPVVDYLLAHHYEKIGIIGTKATIGSQQHEKRLKLARPEQPVAAVPTPLLAAMVEEGFVNNEISRSVIKAYLSHRSLSGIDAIVLACTHYPLIKQDITDYYKHQVDVIDTTEIVAEAVKASLLAQGLLNTTRTASDRFYVSEYTEAFEKTARLFYGEAVRIEEVDLWNETT
ncbi:MAG: glutamate racemase [Chitinophagaceae bacterium]|nr:glutamate racemase [Chitinophagaceae bacterium]